MLPTPEPDNPAGPAGPAAMAVTPEFRRAAVGVLLGQGARIAPEVIDRFLRQAPSLGIDPDLMGAVARPDDPATLWQICLPVLGAGRTVMLFVAGVHDKGIPQNQEVSARAAAIRQAVRLVAAREPVHLVQALIEPGETAAGRAYTEAGLRQLAELLYLSRPLKLGEGAKGLVTPGAVARMGAIRWPGGVSVRPLRADGGDEPALLVALQASYADTLDCPELSGLREIGDIVAAHRAVGDYDPALWWLVERDGCPEGCVLLNRCPSQGCVELVYIGLSPSVRGLGLGESLMRSAIGVCAGLERDLRCAVDARNTPARRLYERLGFRDAGRRVAFVGLARDLV